MVHVFISELGFQKMDQISEEGPERSQIFPQTVLY